MESFLTQQKKNVSSVFGFETFLVATTYQCSISLNKHPNVNIWPTSNMLSNFGAFDVIHDQHMQKEVEKLLKRVGFGSEKEKWNQFRKNGNREQFASRPPSSKIFRSPRTDLEICGSLFSYLRSHLIYHEELSDGSPHSVSLETILQLRRSTRKKRAIPLKQQMELALLW